MIAMTFSLGPIKDNHNIRTLQVEAAEAG